MNTDFIEVNYDEIATGSNASSAVDYESGTDAGITDTGDAGSPDTATDSDSIDTESLYSGPGSLEYQEVGLYESELAQNVTVYNPLQILADDSTDYVNCLRLDCTIDGDACTVLFPPEYIDKIFIDESGRLWNMSASTISGRIVDNQFNPYVTEGRLVYLTACLGNNFSAISNYGSPNYVREYYWSSSRLTYDDTYTEIIVDNYHYPFFASDMWNYIIIFLLFIGVILSWLRNFKHY